MNIGINASSLIHQHPTGVEKYTYEIISHLIPLLTKNDRLLLYTPSELPKEFSRFQNVIRANKYWTQVRLPIELLTHRPDVLFQPSYMLPAICPCPSVITLHDFAWLHFPDAYTKDQIKSQQTALNRAKRLKSEIITPSNATKVDCLKYGGIKEEQIHIIPEALVKLPLADLSKYPKIKQLSDKQVVLAVGRFEKRKNQTIIIKALRLLQKQVRISNFDDIILVLVGSSGVGSENLYSEMSKARKEGIEIIISESVSDNELSCWFAVAKLFVYPSLYEGFGLPILQAFNANVPVICSKNSSIPEVGVNAVWYLDNPNSEEELAVGINALLSDPHKRARLVELGTNRLTHFSWSDAANQTLAVLKLAADTNKR